MGGEGAIHGGRTHGVTGRGLCSGVKTIHGF